MKLFFLHCHLLRPYEWIDAWNMFSRLCPLPTLLLSEILTLVQSPESFSKLKHRLWIYLFQNYRQKMEQKMKIFVPILIFIFSKIRSYFNFSTEGSATLFFNFSIFMTSQEVKLWRDILLVQCKVTMECTESQFIRYWSSSFVLQSHHRHWPCPSCWCDQEQLSAVALQHHDSSKNFQNKN